MDAPGKAGERSSRCLRSTADACEAARVADRRLDVRIALAIFPGLRELSQIEAAVWHHPDGSRVRALRYSSSVSAAATLVPPGHWLEQVTSPADSARIHGPDNDSPATARNALPALAISAAALRAWSRLAGDGGSAADG